MRLTVEDIIRIHDQGVALYGGSYGIRDLNEISSVINNIYLTFGGQELYPEVTDKASFLAFGLIKNHAFVDGNKRVGVATMLTFLGMNNYPIQATNEELIDFGLDVATSKLLPIWSYYLTHNNNIYLLIILCIIWVLPIFSSFLSMFALKFFPNNVDLSTCSIMILTDLVFSSFLTFIHVVFSS